MVLYTQVYNNNLFKCIEIYNAIMKSEIDSCLEDLGKVGVSFKLGRNSTILWRTYDVYPISSLPCPFNKFYELRPPQNGVLLLSINNKSSDRIWIEQAGDGALHLLYDKKAYAIYNKFIGQNEYQEYRFPE